jgi:hypothetical protein
MRITTLIAVVVMTCASANPHSPIPDNRVNRVAGRTLEHSCVRHISHRDSLDDGLEFAQALSNRCLTPYFWCFIPQYVPVGTPCWCATPNGPVGGVVG